VDPSHTNPKRKAEESNPTPEGAPGFRDQVSTAGLTIQVTGARYHCANPWVSPSARDSNPDLSLAEDAGIEPTRTGLQPVALPTELISDRLRRHHQVSQVLPEELRAELTGQDSNLHLTE
jgi:hypothetical protein